MSWENISTATVIFIFLLMYLNHLHSSTKKGALWPPWKNIISVSLCSFLSRPPLYNFEHQFDSRTLFFAELGERKYFWFITAPGKFQRSDRSWGIKNICANSHDLPSSVIIIRTTSSLSQSEFPITKVLHVYFIHRCSWLIN